MGKYEYMKILFLILCFSSAAFAQRIGPKHGGVPAYPNDSTLYLRGDTTWHTVSSSGSAGWDLSGNSGTTSSNFLGTTDGVSLIFKTNGAERMRIDSLGSLLLSGTAGVTPISGAGTRMMWIPGKAAFRGGKVTSNSWDGGNIGNKSFSFGEDTYATGDYSFSVGLQAIATGTSAIAIGTANAVGDNDVAIGSGSTTADGGSSTAIGTNNTYAHGTGSTAIGEGVISNGIDATALGGYTIANGNYSLAAGTNIKVGAGSFGFCGKNFGAPGNLSFTLDISSLSNVACFNDADMILANNDGVARTFRFYEPNSAMTLASANYTAIKAGVQSANITWTLPTAQGGAATVLSNNGSGILSWTTGGTDTLVIRDTTFQYDSTAVITRDTTHSYDTVSVSLPDSAGQSGKFLQTLDGVLGWATPSGSGGTYASLNSFPIDPTGTTNTGTFEMAGLAHAPNSSSITPGATGKVTVIVSGAWDNTVANAEIIFRLSYGSGAAPSNGDAATGTVISNVRTLKQVAAGRNSFSIQGLADGLSLSTPYWIDLQYHAIVSGTVSFYDITITATEIP